MRITELAAQTYEPTRCVSDGHEAVPLAYNITRDEGEVLTVIIRDVKPQTSVEIGLAYGVLTL
jgi:hypothetical protein